MGSKLILRFQDINTCGTLLKTFTKSDAEKISTSIVGHRPIYVTIYEVKVYRVKRDF